MLRNNADARRCSYFELGLPVLNRTETVHGTFHFLYLSHLLYGICVKIFVMNRYISKSYTTARILLTDNIQSGGSCSRVNYYWSDYIDKNSGQWGKKVQFCFCPDGLEGSEKLQRGCFDSHPRWLPLVQNALSQRTVQEIWTTARIQREIHV